jgi:hypothetical protein
MPSLSIRPLIFGTTIAIAIGIVALGLYLKKFFATRKHLKSVRNSLQRFIPAQAGESLALERLEELSATISGDPLIGHAWDEFRETLVTVEGRLFNTDQAERFFSESYLLRELPKYAEAVPGVLTGLGLLGTFVALLVGLAELKVVDGNVANIETLINSLAGKFVSSIVGLTAALLYTPAERIAHDKAHGYVERLQQELNRLFQHMTPEKLLYMSLNESKKQTRAMESLASDLTERVQVSVMGDVSREIERILAATEGLKEGLAAKADESLTQVKDIRAAVLEIKSHNSDSMADTLRGIMDEFRQSLTGAANNDLQALARTLGDAANFLKGLEDSNKNLDERMSKLLENLSAGLREQQAQFGEQSRQMSAVMEQMIGRLEGSSSQSLDAFQQRIEQMMSQTADWSGALQRQLEGLLGKLDVSANNQRDAMNDQLKALTDQMQGLIHQLEVSQQQHVQGVQASVQSMVTQVGQVTGDQMAQLDRARNSLADSQQAGLDAMKVQVGKLFDSIAEELVEQQKQTSQVLRDAVATQTSLTIQVQELISQLSASRKEHEQGVQDAVHRLITDLGTLTGDQTAELDRARHYLADSQQAGLEAIKSEIGQLFNMIAADLTNRESQSRKTFQDAIAAQKVLVQQLRGAGESLTEVFELYRDTLDDNKSLLEQASPLVQGLSEAAQGLGHSAQRFGESNRQMAQALEGGKEVAQSYERVFKELQTLHERQREVYHRLDSGLGNILSQIDTNLRQYQTTVGDGLQANTDQWHKSLTEATNLLHGNIENLRDYLDELNEILGRNLTHGNGRPVA